MPDFTWDANVLAEQVTGGTATTWDTEPGGPRPLTQVERTVKDQEWVDERFHAIVTDLVGAPAELVDPAGGLAWHAQSTIWGVALDRAPTGVPGNRRSP